MPTTKAEYRRQLHINRLMMSDEELAAKSYNIIEKCQLLITWNKVSTLHSFIGSKQLREIDTTRLLEHSWQQYPAIKTAVPKMDTRDQFRSIIVNAETPWQLSNLGIPEPAAGKPVEPGQQFSVIIVPMLGFDARGYRLGYGKGVYDRFLAGQPRAKTIGLCYESGFIDVLPVEPHDVALQYIVTEKRVLNFTS